MSENERTVKVSVILAVFNESSLVVRCIESVLSQDVDGLELVIIDDCSTDGTYDIISKFKSDIVTVIKNEVNLGLTKSLNVGLNVARGELIARIDADDRFLPGKLKAQIREFSRDPELRFLACGYYNMDIEHQRCFKVLPPRGRSEVIEKLTAGGSPFLHSSIMWKRDGRHDYYYIEEFKQGQDAELWGRIIAEGKFDALQEPFVVAARNRAASIVGKRGPLKALRLKRKIAKCNQKTFGVPCKGTIAFYYSGVKIIFWGSLRQFAGSLGFKRVLRKLIKGQRKCETEAFHEMYTKYYS